MNTAKKILVVDDEKDIVRLLESRLTMNGFEVYTAFDGVEALKKVKEIKPDLIILDIMLPKIDGFQVCRIIKYDIDYKNIPIILLTAKASQEDQDKGKEVGADLFIVKPFESGSLISEIKKLLKME